MQKSHFSKISKKKENRERINTQDSQGSPSNNNKELYPMKINLFDDQRTNKNN